MEKTFYAIVTQYDSSAEQAQKWGAPQEGPVLYECYLNEAATDEQRVRAFAQRFSGKGWVRIAKVTVDIPGE